MKNIYFDNAATTKMDSSVLDDMMPYLTDNYGNASSIYSLGKVSRQAIEESRKKIADILSCNQMKYILLLVEVKAIIQRLKE